MNNLKLHNVFFVIVMIIFCASVNAEDGRLMDEYPPNVEAENFTLSDMQGVKHQLKDYRGKTVLVNFWAMSCNICKSELTTLQSAYELIDSDELAIVSVHAGSNFDGVEDVLKLSKVTYDVLFDTALQLGDWGVPILPTTFIVDPNGNIRYRAVGTRVWNSPFMVDFIQDVMNNELVAEPIKHL